MGTAINATAAILSCLLLLQEEYLPLSWAGLCCILSGMFDYIHHEATSEQNGRLLQPMVLVTKFSESAGHCCCRTPRLLTEYDQAYLSVPTPPASSSIDGLSCKFLPIHLIANARRMWPWATRSTSGGGPSPVLPIAGP